MWNRCCRAGWVAAIVLCGTGVPASAGPFLWGYRAVDEPTGRLLSEGTGITQSSLILDLLALPRITWQPNPTDTQTGIYEPGPRQRAGNRCRSRVGPE